MMCKSTTMYHGSSSIEGSGEVYDDGHVFMM